MLALYSLDKYLRSQYGLGQGRHARLENTAAMVVIVVLSLLLALLVGMASSKVRGRAEKPLGNSPASGRDSGRATIHGEPASGTFETKPDAVAD